MTPNEFRKVNGFSNKFYGWGGEDDDMKKRWVQTVNFSIDLTCGHQICSHKTILIEKYTNIL